MKKPAWLTRKVLIRGGAALAMVAAVISFFHCLYFIKQSGFGPDETVTRSEKIDKQGKITETTTSTTFQHGKTLWDWLSLLGVPFSLAILGYILQQLQQAHADQQAKVEKEIAESNQHEEALQNYLDRLSELLIDKNLIATAVKRQADTKNQAEDNPPRPTTLEEKELLNAAKDVIRARTLSILRRLGKDGKRKGDVIRFLVEAEVISKLELDLSDANLGRADLSRANLSRADLLGADLSDASLSRADLSDANLGRADLSRANLSRADLSSAYLGFAHLSDANLSGANLSRALLVDANLWKANLSGVKNWTEAPRAKARLCQTKLPEGCNLDPNRDCEVLGISPDPSVPASPE